MTISDARNICTYAERQSINAMYRGAEDHIESMEFNLKHVGSELKGNDRTSYNKEIKVRIDAIRAKVLATKNDPKQAHMIYQIVDEGRRELNTFVDAFWAGRDAALKTGQSVSDQFAKINAAATQALTPGAPVQKAAEPLHHFPETKKLQRCLADHPLVKDPYLKNVVKLAAERFGDKDVVKDGVTIGTRLVINDLAEGKDGFTGASLPKMTLADSSWNVIGINLETALVACANGGNNETKSDNRLFKTAMVVTGIGGGMTGVAIHEMIQETKNFGLRLAGGALTGGLIGYALGEAFSAKEAH